jgi:hypothetical protein
VSVDLVSAVRLQAKACDELGSPMYAEVLTRIGTDIEQRGVFAGLLAGHEDDPGPSAIALRLLGSVHRLVLEGTASELAAYYASVGGTWQTGAGWDSLVRTVRDHADAVRRRLEQPPQTNEVGRSAVLLGGLRHVVAEQGLPVRLCEIGASGGLNLLADRFCYVDDDGRMHGQTDSPVRLQGAWAGRRPPDATVEVVDRLGSDVAPVDVSAQAGRLTLLSYVWPDQTARLQRLRDAFRVADATPVSVCRSSAADFVGDLRLTDGVSTVLWHSVMWQYMSRSDQQVVAARLAELGDRATRRCPFAHLSFEPQRRTAADPEHEFLVVLRTWPGGGRRILAAAAPHGLPTVWE